jgi:hypothetical protein
LRSWQISKLKIKLINKVNKINHDNFIKNPQAFKLVVYFLELGVSLPDSQSDKNRLVVEFLPIRDRVLESGAMPLNPLVKGQNSRG